MKRLIILFFLLLPTPVLAIDSEEEIGCLVEAVYFEARGESLAAVSYTHLRAHET